MLDMYSAFVHPKRWIYLFASTSYVSVIIHVELFLGQLFLTDFVLYSRL